MDIVALVEEVVRWVGPAFTGTTGYLVIAGAVLLERSILIGLVVPGEVTLAVGAIYVSRGDLDLSLVIAIGAICAIVGESVGYWLGRRYGRSLLSRIPLANRLAEKVEEVEDLFERHGGKTVAIGRYAAAAGAFVPFVAGMGRMRFLRFLAFDVPAIVVWAIGVGLLGFFLGENLELVDRILSRFGYAMLGLLAVLVGLYVWKRARERRREA